MPSCTTCTIRKTNFLFFFFIPNHPIFKAIKYSSIRFENRMISLMPYYFHYFRVEATRFCLKENFSKRKKNQNPSYLLRRVFDSREINEKREQVSRA